MFSDAHIMACEEMKVKKYDFRLFGSWVNKTAGSSREGFHKHKLYGSYGLPSRSLCRPFRFEKDSGQKVNNVSECKGEKFILWIYVAFHRSFIAHNKCAWYAKVITTHVSREAKFYVGFSDTI